MSLTSNVEMVVIRKDSRTTARYHQEDVSVSGRGRDKDAGRRHDQVAMIKDCSGLEAACNKFKAAA